MWSQFFKRKPTQDKQGKCDTPVVEGHRHIFPEPLVVDHTVTVPLDNVHHGVELDNPVVLFRDHFHRPKDWCQPKSELNQHRNKLSHISEKDNHR